MKTILIGKAQFVYGDRGAGEAPGIAKKQTIPNSGIGVGFTPTANVPNSAKAIKKSTGPIENWDLRLKRCCRIPNWEQLL